MTYNFIDRCHTHCYLLQARYYAVMLTVVKIMGLVIYWPYDMICKEKRK